MIEWLSKLPVSLFSGLIVAIVVIVLFVPVALRVAGLTGQQIAEVLAMTTRVFLELVREFRAENKDK